MLIKSFLLSSIAKSVIILVVGWVLLAVLLQYIDFSRESEIIFGLISAIGPLAVADWWLFRICQVYMSRQEARAVATAFAVCAPLALLIAVPIANIPASYAAYLGRPFGLVGALIATWAIVALFCFLCCSFVLRFMRRAQPDMRN